MALCCGLTRHPTPSPRTAPGWGLRRRRVRPIPAVVTVAATACVVELNCKEIAGLMHQARIPQLLVVHALMYYLGPAKRLLSTLDEECRAFI